MFKIGVRVETEKGRGVVEFCGVTEFGDGIWVGVNLDEPNGKHNGTVKGVRYFECEPDHGIFVKASQVRLEGRGKSSTHIPTSVRKDVRSKISPLSSPKLTPSSSAEKLKGGNNTSLLSTKKHSAEDTKGSAEKSSGKSLHNAQGERTSEVLISDELSEKLDDNPKKGSISSRSEVASDHYKNLEKAATSGSVKNLVKKVGEISSSVAAVLPSGMNEENELEWLRIQNKDLSEKLESLRIKRKEDHVKLVEYERNRIQLDALLQFKAKVLKEQTTLQRKLQEKEKELKEVLALKQNESEDVTEVEERLELLAVEKEMAEEKVELLQAEVEAEKQRVQELEFELTLLRNEIKQTGDNSFQINSVQMKQLEQQNEKLREALVRMRDVTGQMVFDKQEIMQENERLKDELAALTKLCEKMKNDVDVYKNTVDELREQVDVALGSEKMIETLTERNLNMEEKIRTLEETIEDFEAMRAMDEEILETQKDTEKDLRGELDRAFGRINELLLQIKAYTAQAEDYESTVLMFRKKVGIMNEEIQERNDENLRLKEQIKTLEEGRIVPGMQHSYFTVTRAFSEVVDAEMRSVELEFALKQIEYLKAFMPDNFTKPGGDYDAIMLNVLFPRLCQKSMVLARLMSCKNPPVPGGIRREHVTKSHKAEQWAHCAKFCYLLNAFDCVVRKFESAIQCCSVERLSQLAHLQLEMAAQERMIDQYTELLKTDHLDENTSSENLEKGITYFQNVFAVHMVGEMYDMKQTFSDIITQLLTGMGWMKINAQRFMYFLLPGSEESEMYALANTLMALISECEQLIIRSRNHIPAQKEITLSNQVEKKLLTVVNTLTKVACAVDSVCSVASIQLSTHADEEGLQSDRIKEMLQGVVEKINGQTDSTKAQELIRSSMLALKVMLENLTNELDGGALDEKTKSKKPFRALLERAHARKQDAVEAEGLRWQLEKKENEISDLKKTLRNRADDISNYKLRLEMADKKIEMSGRADESRVSRLQSRYDELQNELKRRKDEYEETMDELQKELEASEKENAELKERAKTISKKALLMNLTNSLNPLAASSAATFNSSVSCTATLSEIGFLETALSEKEYAVKAASEKIRLLKAQNMLRLLSNLDSYNVSAEISGPLTLAAVQGPYKEELDKLVKEAESIMGEARKYQVPYIGDPSKSKQVQLVERSQYYSSVENINFRINNLKVKMHRFWSKYMPRERMPRLYDNIESIVAKRTKEPLQNDEGRGLHSSAYRNAYNFLFGNLNVERKITEMKGSSLANI